MHPINLYKKIINYQESREKSNTNGIEINAKEIQIKKQIITTIIEPKRNLFAFINDILK